MAHTELFSQTHSAPEDTSERDILTEDDGGIIFRERDAEGHGVSPVVASSRSQGRTSWHPGPPGTCSSCGSLVQRRHRPGDHDCLRLPSAGLECAKQFRV